MRQTLSTQAQLRNILAVQRLSQIPKLHRVGILRLFIVRVCGRVDGEDLIVAQGEDSPVVEETGVVDGAVVDHLDQGIVFVCDGCVVDVD